MSNVTRLHFRSEYGTLYVRVNQLERLNEDAGSFVWQAATGPEDLAWLNANAAGWTFELLRGAVETLDLPLGAEPRADFLQVQVILLFLEAGHRAAWDARRESERQHYDELRQRVEQQLSAAPEGTMVCRECAVYMEPIREPQVERIAQFELKYEIDCHTCPQCGTSTTKMGDLAEISRATEIITTRVGLPLRGSPLWTETVGAEWRRRKEAPAEFTLEVTPDMEAAQIIAMLDDQLAAAGQRVPVQRPQLRLV